MVDVDTALRAQIRAEFQTIVPCDAVEERHLASAVAWLDSGAELFRTEKPATPHRHLVAYFVCVDGDQVLLVDHKKAQLWLPPGGHVEPGEHPRVTVSREIEEELGVTAELAFPEPLMLTVTKTQGLGVGHTDVSLWYVLRLERERELRFDAREFHGVQWFATGDVPHARSDPHMARFLQKLEQRMTALPT
jgi:8-oxo-dGTP diphosphatase